MKKMVGFGAAMIGLLLMLPDDVRGQKRDDKKSGNVVQAGPEDYKALAKTSQISAIIVSADAKSLTFRVDTPRLQPTPGKRSYPKIVHMYKEFEVDVSDKLVVKKMFVNADYDDKGNFKVNEAAAKELRIKGYITSKIEDVKSGNLARLTLSPPKKGDEVAGVGNVSKPLVKSIVLEKEGTPVEPAKAMEKKKKN